MPEGDTSVPGQAPGALASQSPSGGQVPAAPVVPVTPPADPAAPSEPVAGGKPSLTLEQALDALDKARKEAAASRVDRKRMAELEEAQRKAEEAKLSETEKLQKRLSDLQTAQVEKDRKAQERVIRAEVRAQAAGVGIAAELAGKLIDYAEIEFDDDGEPRNIGALLQQLLKQYPQLAASAAASSSAAAATGKPAAAPQPTSVGATPANPARSGAGSGVITEEFVRSLTPQQYANLPPERRLEVQQWMAQQAIRK